MLSFEAVTSAILPAAHRADPALSSMCQAADRSPWLGQACQEQHGINQSVHFHQCGEATFGPLRASLQQTRPDYFSSFPYMMLPQNPGISNAAGQGSKVRFDTSGHDSPHGQAL